MALGALGLLSWAVVLTFLLQRVGVAASGAGTALAGAMAVLGLLALGKALQLSRDSRPTVRILEIGTATIEAAEQAAEWAAASEYAAPPHG